MEDQQQFVLVRISIAEVNGQKALKVPPSDTISSVKFQIIDKLTGVNIENILNYGLWLPGSDGKEGKFLDEQRSVKDYRLSETTLLELRPKHKMGLEYGSKQYVKDNNPKTQKKIMEVVKEGKKDEIKNRITKGIDPNFLSEDGLTPLVQAVLADNRDLISTLVELGAILDYRCKVGTFQSGQAMNAFSSTWLTPMHVAAAESKLVALQTLMYYGASPCIPDSAKALPISHACINGCTEAIKWLFVWAGQNYRDGKFGFDLDAKDSQERTYLHLAVQSGNLASIKAVLEVSSTVFATNSAGNTPLHTLAARITTNTAETRECVKALLEYGADKEQRNKANQTPVQIALMTGNMDVVDLLRKWKPPAENFPKKPMTTEEMIENSKIQWLNIKNLMGANNSSSKLNLKPSASKILSPMSSSLSTTFSTVSFDNSSGGKKGPSNSNSIEIPDSSSVHQDNNRRKSNLSTLTQSTTSKPTTRLAAVQGGFPSQENIDEDTEVNAFSPVSPNTNLSDKFTELSMASPVQANSTAQMAFATSQSPAFVPDTPIFGIGLAASKPAGPPPPPISSSFNNMPAISTKVPPASSFFPVADPNSLAYAIPKAPPAAPSMPPSLSQPNAIPQFKAGPITAPLPPPQSQPPVKQQGPPKAPPPPLTLGRFNTNPSIVPPPPSVSSPTSPLQKSISALPGFDGSSYSTAQAGPPPPPPPPASFSNTGGYSPMPANGTIPRGPSTPVSPTLVAAPIPPFANQQSGIPPPPPPPPSSNSKVQQPAQIQRVANTYETGEPDQEQLNHDLEQLRRMMNMKY